MVLLAQGDDERASGGLLGLSPGAEASAQEEGGLGVVAKVVAQDAEGAWGVTECAGGLLGGTAFDKVGAQGLVLALFGGGGLKEEGARVR